MIGKHSVTGRGGIVGLTSSGSQISDKMRPGSSSVRIEPTYRSWRWKAKEDTYNRVSILAGVRVPICIEFKFKVAGSS